MPSATVVFADKIVTATDLNRHARQVLDHAWDHGWLTIVRNDQTFALLRRDLAARLFAETARAELLLELIRAALLVCSGEKLDLANQHEWVAAFNPADLQTMVGELCSAYGRARSGDLSWDEFDATVHEWQESAWAVRSPEARAGFESEVEEVPLTTEPPG